MFDCKTDWTLFSKKRTGKLSSFVTDLLGTSARRMLPALAEGETDPANVAALADRRLRATPDQLRNALDDSRATRRVQRRVEAAAVEELLTLPKLRLDAVKGVVTQLAQEAIMNRESDSRAKYLLRNFRRRESCHIGQQCRS